MESVIVTEGMSKQYGKLLRVNRLNLSVPEGGETNIGLTYKPSDKVDEKSGTAVLRSNNMCLRARSMDSWGPMGPENPLR